METNYCEQYNSNNWRKFMMAMQFSSLLFFHRGGCWCCCCYCCSCSTDAQSCCKAIKKSARPAHIPSRNVHSLFGQHNGHKRWKIKENCYSLSSQFSIASTQNVPSNVLVISFCSVRWFYLIFVGECCSFSRQSSNCTDKIKIFIGQYTE